MCVEGRTSSGSVNWHDAWLSLTDGVKLVARLWVPKGEGPWPALVMRQPYGRALASTVTYIHPGWWASHGYLVVVQDVRGQGDSEGHFNGFLQEASDTSQTHAWVRELPECNGLLGTYGFSYQGLTQLLAEPGTPPPDCLAPAMAGVDERNHWSCDGGAHWWHLGLAWGLQLAALQARRCGNWEAWTELRRSLEDDSYLYEGPVLLKRHDPDGMTLRWLHQSSQNDQGWVVHKPLDSWLRQPMLLLGGWWDPHLNGLLDLYQRSIQVGGSPELHIGPATHLQWCLMHSNSSWSSLIAICNLRKPQPIQDPMGGSGISRLVLGRNLQAPPRPQHQPMPAGVLSVEGWPAWTPQKAPCIRTRKVAAWFMWSMTLGDLFKQWEDISAQNQELLSAAPWTSAPMWPPSPALLFRKLSN